MSLYGQYNHQIDDKFRLRIPPKLKPIVGDHPVITLGKNKCLYVYEESVWEQEVKSSFAEIGVYSDNEEKLRMKRKVFANTYKCEEDKQGRITINPLLASKADITKNIVSIGVDTHIEIWDEQTWIEYSEGDI